MTKKTTEEIAALRAKYATENAAKNAKRLAKKEKFGEVNNPTYTLPQYLQSIEDLDKYSSVWCSDPEGWYSREIKKDPHTGIYGFTERWVWHPPIKDKT